MATLVNVLKEEIVRLARKEIRKHAAEAAKLTTQVERDVTALKRQVQDLQRKLSAPQTQDGPKQTTSKKTGSKKTGSKKTAAKSRTGKAAGAASTPAVQQSARTPFSSAGLKASRERVGLSADNYGKLIGVSGLSIYNWESGKARPRESNIAALTTIKGIGKREAAKRLEALAKPEASEGEAAGGS